MKFTLDPHTRAQFEATQLKNVAKSQERCALESAHLSKTSSQDDLVTIDVLAQHNNVKVRRMREILAECEIDPDEVKIMSSGQRAALYSQRRCEILISQRQELKVIDQLSDESKMKLFLGHLGLEGTPEQQAFVRDFMIAQTTPLKEEVKQLTAELSKKEDIIDNLLTVLEDPELEEERSDKCYSFGNAIEERDAFVDTALIIYESYAIDDVKHDKRMLINTVKSPLAKWGYI